MTLRVVPGYRRICRSNIGRVSVNIGKVPRGKEIVSEIIGMVPKRERMFSEWFRRFRETSEWFREGWKCSGVIYVMFINNKY